jgi:lipopolysaccharide biosynthesis glycosyltransferase
MINILYAGNSGVFDGILTSSLSAVMRMKEPRPIKIHIFTMDITRLGEKYTPLCEKEARYIEKCLREHNPESYVTLYDVGPLYDGHLKFNANEGCYCSPYTLLRLLADLIPEIPDKLLYLDADVMFNKDISLLWDTDISDVEYAAARDHYGKFLLNSNYINAGVLLFNMKKCRESGIFEKARELIRTKKLTFADQSALIRSTEKKKMLSQRFNDQKFLYKKTVIRHFSKRLFYLPYPHTENIKQWQIEKVRKKFGYTEFDDILNCYLTAKENYLSEKPKCEPVLFV